MSDTERLHRVEARFNIIAQTGGFQRLIRAIDRKDKTVINLEIEDPSSGARMWLRVVPDWEEVTLLDGYTDIYVFNRATGLFLTDKNGNEKPDAPIVDVWASINTASIPPGMPAGTLKMWEYSLEVHHQIGA